MTLKNIKDMSPNPALIEQVEKLLEDVKAGKVRSAVWVSCWDDNSTSHAWAVDKRSRQDSILTEIVKLQHQYLINQQLFDEFSVLSQALRDRE